MTQPMQLTTDVYEAIIYAMIEIINPDGSYNGDLIHVLSSKTGFTKNMVWMALKKYRLENRKS